MSEAQATQVLLPLEARGTIRKRHTKQRVLVAFREEEVISEVSAYEKKRQENIRKNEALLQSLGIRSNELLQATRVSQTSVYRRKRRTTETESTAPLVRRKSRRLRQRAQGSATVTEHDAAEPLEELDDEENEYRKMMTMEEYCKHHNFEPQVKTTGHFEGWVKEEVRLRLGIAPSAEEAWENNGGGTFSFKTPTGKKGSGSTNALEIARKSLLKNPNAYFYRLTEPGEARAFGDWTESEIQLFVEVAKKFGCGDKWGLFASYIPHRVGYQCSAIYRQEILPRGLVIDPNFLISPDGRKTVYKGWSARRKQ